MLKKTSLIILLGVCYFHQISVTNAQTTFDTEIQKEAQLLHNLLTEKHYSPPKIDDAFSSSLFNTFLNQLDPNRIYFLKSDIVSLHKFASQLDDEWKGANWKFLQQITSIYKERLISYKKNIHPFINENLDFNVKESLVTGYDSLLGFPANLQEQKFLSSKT